jgi:hypothetical protein
MMSPTTQVPTNATVYEAAQDYYREHLKHEMPLFAQLSLHCPIKQTVACVDDVKLLRVNIAEFDAKYSDPVRPALVFLNISDKLTNMPFCAYYRSYASTHYDALDAHILPSFSMYFVFLFGSSGKAWISRYSDHEHVSRRGQKVCAPEVLARIHRRPRPS